ncbi:MAG TPA: AMP-binding protein [Leptospiraceae bacterium]|nr:AMP-binding protein [Leptospirales bacterium]HMW59387.1 AMP-binding protein [Leptospiraceae bacterium]HMX55448.1 AMP-binding protein [Leptospiraceae bacterium]HMZ35743.1 AMP-binding protein [Leptospiraceae bacterium]HNE22320.1 AMP-binding protein [Leptospiraceae bacterium]
MNTLIDALSEAASTTRGIQFFDRSGSITRFNYSELYADAQKIARVMAQHGLAPGQSAGLVFSTSYEFVRQLFGVLLAGGVPFCLAPPRLGRAADYSEYTARMINSAGARFVIHEDSIGGSLAKVAARTSSPFIPVSQIVADIASASPETKSVTRDRPALIQFSSGTTVDPKPVVLTHGNLVSNTKSILERFPGDINDHSGLSWLPMHHDMGLIGGLFSAVMGKGDITFLRPEDFVMRPALWLRALSETKATTCPCPNFALKLCTDRIETEDVKDLDLSHWQIALVGAETVHLSTLRDFAEKFAITKFRYAAFTPVYGLAEATLAVTFSDLSSPPHAERFDSALLSQGKAVETSETGGSLEIASVGKPLSGFELQIRDDSGAEAQEGQVGRIFLRGESIMQGYLGQPPHEGWLDTGDLGFIHKGDLYIYGRAKDVIIINGRNHDPAYIEFATEGVPGIRHERTAAFAVSSDTRATEGFILLVEKEKGDLRNQEEVVTLVRDSVTEKTGLIPDSVHIIEIGQMPRTTSGKVRRAEARRQFLSGKIAALASS